MANKEMRSFLLSPDTESDPLSAPSNASSDQIIAVLGAICYLKPAVLRSDLQPRTATRSRKQVFAPVVAR